VVILAVKNIRHTCDESIALNVHFLDRAAVHPFQIEHEAWVGNYPERVKGKLTVEARLREDPAN
jgi:hypothetical protein